MKNYPQHWRELTIEQKDKVERYIRTILAQQVPLVEKPGREVVEQRLEAGISYQLEKIFCGKNCKGCPHGPYWYAYFRYSQFFVHTNILPIVLTFVTTFAIMVQIRTTWYEN